MNYIELFKKSVSEYGDRAALVDSDGTRSMTYSELDALSGKVAGKLKSTGVTDGFVVINMPRRAEYIAAYFGVLKAGCCVVPVVPDYPAERIDYIVANCSAKTVITEDFFLDIDRYTPFENAADGNAPAILVYTSGSTGKPKGILHSAADMARSALRHTVFYEELDELVFGATAQMSFAATVYEYLTVLAMGGTVHILPDKTRKSASGLAAYFVKHGVTASWIVPQMLRIFVNTDLTGSRFRLAVCGGERMSKIKPESFDIINVYGSTEVFGIISMFKPDREYENTPIGKTLSPLSVIIADENGNPVPDGNEGEICAVGEFDSVYYDDTERTERTMCRRSDGLTVLHTGDIGYRNENGDLVYVNRRDWMVKINGQRVETLEIESLLISMPEIENAAVKAFTDDNEQTYLVAFYSVKAYISESEIRARLEKKLTSYMIPRFFTEMDELPKNANGKLDRNALLPADTELYKAEYVSPETELEKALCYGFSKVLSCGRVGRNDDFFALGGDSIKVLKLIEATGISSLTPDSILSGKTPAGIASLCGDAGHGHIVHSDTIPKVCPLTESQKGVYLECAENPESTMYNIPMLCRLPGGTDRARFVSAVRTVISKHKVFGITVGTPDGVPSMIYRDVEIEITEKSVTDIDGELETFVRPFDLEKGPLCRFELCSCGDELAFIYDVHHIIFDGTSSEVFISQIADAYCGKDIPDETLTEFDVSVYEKASVGSDEYVSAEKFFASRLDGTDCDSRPIPDMILADAPTGAGRVLVDTGDKFTLRDVEAFTKTHKITENTLFLGAFSYALAKFNGSQDVSFCTVNSGRHDTGLSSSVGMFVKTLPLYRSFDESALISDYLPDVQSELFETMTHDCIPFGELASRYGVNTGVVFIYQAEMFSGADIENGKISVSMVETGNSQSDIDFMLVKNSGGYELMVHYRKSLYTEPFVRSFANLYLNVVRGMMISETLGDIALTDHADRERQARFNRTETGYDDTKTVVRLFREQAEKTPDNVCLVFEDKRYTYREIDEITDRLAKYLKQNGVGKEKVVGVLIPRCEYMLICSLGILKAGGAYLPLDPTYPPERLNLMMKDSEAMILISDPALDCIITGEFTGMRIPTDSIPSLTDSDTVLTEPDVSDLFVMLYTSGSTGTPKGVMFEHSNALVTTEWVKKHFGLGEDSRVVSYASYGFDAHVFDVYPAVTSGAELHIISDDIRLDFIALRKYFNDNGITHAVMTTQIARQFALMGGFTSLKYISAAGEKLTPFDLPGGFTFSNLYGPTEGSVITSSFKVDRKYRDIPIGKPVGDLKAYIVDKNGKLLPIGAVGELLISGPHVTRGYKNRPEKTLEAYGANRFDTEKGYERIYRTGDIVRMLDDGNLQFIGRRDMQVKIRGFRVELTEIEEVIRRYPGIKDATVAAFDDKAGGKFVAAYVVSDGDADVSAIADFIRGEKPPYMVPAVIMQIDSIPLTQNQKVNKRALPVPKRTLSKILPPENDTQKKIFGIISEVIGHTEFGIDTDIYEAGLTSIGAVKLNVALAEAFDAPLKLSDIKHNPTVKMLETLLTSSSVTKSHPVLDDYPISSTQSGIFVECMSEPGSTVYNMPLLLRIGDGIDVYKLKSAVISAVNAHPYVKTTLFTDKNGEVRAKRNDGNDALVSVISADALPDALVRPFTLLEAPLYRAEIYKTLSGNYLFTDFHHIICDGTSEGILLHDIDLAYSGVTPETEKYSGFEAALDEQKNREGLPYENAKKYWKNLLSGCETECLPKSEPEGEDGFGCIDLADGNAEAVEKFCADNSLSESAFFNSVFGYVLGKFCGKDEPSFVTVYNGRNDSRLNNSVTMLVKTLPVAVSPNGEKAIADYVRETQKQLIESMANDIFSFADISHECGIKADIMFVYQGNGFAFDRLCGEKAERIPLSLGAAKAPITLNVYLTENGYDYSLEYRKENYGEKFGSALLDSFAAAVSEFTKKQYIKDVSLITDTAEKLYRELNGSGILTEDTVFPAMFERSVKLYPDKTAVISCGKKLTYRELNERANVMAHNLMKLGVRKDTIVGYVLDKCCEILVTEIAVMKAGGAFLPMIPGYPDERIDYCLTNSESPFVITTEEILGTKKELFTDSKAYKTLTLESLLAGDETGDPDIHISGDQLAYCIYTSGSTGTPKGVMIEHHNLSGFLKSATLPLDYYRDPKYGGTALALSSPSFDMSLYELYLPLIDGKTVYIVNDEEQHNPLMLGKVLTDNNVQMMVCTPSFMNNLVGIPELSPAIAKLRTIVVGAEAFPPALYDALRKINPDLQIINGYGPTECTICCAQKVLESDIGITIGKPTANAKMYVADKDGTVLPPYCVGELLICGDCVGRGYVKLPEKTASVFRTLNGIPAYRSGDLVRLNGNAEIEFGGRIDNQVKLRGFRVELDEIEKVMCSYEGVKQAKVLVRNNGTEDYLAGFFTAVKETDIESLTEFLKSRLTYYMVPAVLMQIDVMPLTPNGKIDKKGFPEVTKSAKKKTGKRAPKKSLEQRLCEIFGSVLGLGEVYADDNFFELGGTSLSASKVTMLLMSDGIEVKYGDIFDNPTPEALSDFIGRRDSEKAVPAKPENTDNRYAGSTRDALKYNTVKYTPEVRREPLGNVLLTGAVGFLGIHILKELLEIESGHIYCLVRKGRHESAEVRLKTMLVYYFSDGFEDALRNKITLIDADITDASLADALNDVPFDTVINCAACVKHFADDDILERINVRGVENLISICEKSNKKLIQISTVSVPGIHTKETYEKQIRMHENELFVIDDMDNKYGISKYHAELSMFEAIERGMRGKVIRVGNLMGRHSDGEFQVNFETNMFLSGIRGFAFMGKYPISHMTDPMSFSPVDCTARAVVLLSGTNDKFTAFNCNNRYGFDEMKIIDACNRNGIRIIPEADEIYYAEFRKKLGDERVNSRLNGLAAYDIKDAHTVDTDNLFTTNILYRIGFSWPLVDDAYLERAINSIMTLDYFDMGEPDTEDGQ